LIVTAPNEVKARSGNGTAAGSATVSSSQISKHFLAGISLANLAFIKTWSWLLFAGQGYAYFFKTPNDKRCYVAAVAGVVILGTATGFCFVLRRSIVPLVALAGGTTITLLCLNILNNVRGLFQFSLVLPARLSVVAVGGAAVLVAVLRWNAAFCTVVERYSLYCSPFLICTLSGAVINCCHLITTKPGEEHPVPPGRRPQAERRVLWIIFDELDQRHGLENLKVSVPAFRSLEMESFCATNAYPPANSTMLSLPALVTGRRLLAVKLTKPDDLLLCPLSGTNYESWRATTNLFAKADAAGFNCAVVGWYHPYDRLFGNHLRFSYFEPFPPYSFFGGDSFLQILVRQISDTLLPLTGRFAHSQVHARLVERAIPLICRADLNLILIHLSVPHLPRIWTSPLDFLDPRNFSLGTAYFRNIQLADETLARFRAEMVRGGVWDRTTVIVSSDHWWRASSGYDGITDQRVPFIVKLPAGRHFDYGRRLSTIFTEDLVMSVLQGDLRSSADLVRWVDGNRIDARPIETGGKEVIDITHD
jgi:hypothetical protein